MKKNLIIKTTRLAIAATIILCASMAAASDIQGNTAAMIETDDSSFQLVPLEIPSIDSGIDVAANFPSRGYLQELLAEMTAYQEESRPLIRDMKSKWTDLTDELSKQVPEVERVSDLQSDISALDTQLVTMRLNHLQALNKIKTASGELRLLASR